MSVIKIIIADENQSYAKGLAQYLQEEGGQAFEVICFTQSKILMEYLSKNEVVVDILLISPPLLIKDMSSEQYKSLILLVENMDSGIEGSIYKYQKANQIQKLLLQEYDKKANYGINVLNSNQNCKLVCVYSPSGAAGKTTVAYNLAVQYSMKAKKVLFISLEPYSALPIFSKESSRGLIYMLYLIKNKLPNLLLKLNTIITTDDNTNINFMEREKNVLEYKDLKMDDFEMLTDFLKNQSNYEAVILDLDSSMNDLVLGAFKFSDVIINVHCEDQVSCAKQECFKKQISKINNLLEQDINSKLLEVRNKSQFIAKSVGTEKLIEIPIIQGEGISLGTYFPEMTYFKQLYDAVENSYKP